uniref:Insulin-like domain-containing protein n=1 Tax=Monopterus albus TaxID=43700 RepID=A0A3Q3IX80_MONAL
MRFLFQLAMLLCGLCVAQVQTQDDPNTMRLCGRKLLRALVYTCGGSRWRRLTGGEDKVREGNREPNLLKMSALDRHWRDQNQALITTCCQQGCRKSDLYMLC